ncbi:MAG: hypothetical protein UZ22_OP11002000485 [Microgenomates bacterium OLB23]|nr:MAG: hypothetical protein UZ22_OP11002000485 [Microgenomates bacterium OLB23]
MISPTNRYIYMLAVGLFSAAAAMATLFCIKAMYKNKTEGLAFRVLAYYGVLSIFIAWAGGLWLPAATPTRIQFVLPAIYLLVAAGFMHMLTYKHIKPIAWAGMSVLCIIQLFFSIDYLVTKAHHRENWRDAIAYSDELLKNNASSVVLTVFNNKWAPMDWYSAYPEKYHGGSTYSLEDPVQKNGNAHTFIIVYTYLYEIFDPQLTLENQLSKDYNLELEKNFKGVGIIKLYKLNESRTSNSSNHTYRVVPFDRN